MDYATKATLANFAYAVKNKFASSLSVNGKTVTLKNGFGETLSTITTQDTTYTIDAALSSSSTNPVQNKSVNAALANKVDKISGKGLSTEDFTSSLKTKLEGIAVGATAVTVDTTLSATSNNAISNAAVYSAIASYITGELNGGI